MPPPSLSLPTNAADCAAALSRLIGNVSGFVYRRRPDAAWTMDFVSAGCRDVTGFEPHRFIGNASIAFADLIAAGDRPRVDARVEFAVEQRRRAVIEYRLRTAYGTWTVVEDRFVPVFDESGALIAIEGIIDRARRPHPPAGPGHARPPMAETWRSPFVQPVPAP
jgi:PAS domain-containing protein